MFSTDNGGTITSSDGYCVRTIGGVIYQDNDGNVFRFPYEVLWKQETKQAIFVIAPYLIQCDRWTRMDAAQQEAIVKKVRQALEWKNSLVVVEFSDRIQDEEGREYPFGSSVKEFMAGLDNVPDWMKREFKT